MELYLGERVLACGCVLEEGRQTRRLTAPCREIAPAYAEAMAAVPRAWLADVEHARELVNVLRLIVAHVDGAKRFERT